MARATVQRHVAAEDRGGTIAWLIVAEWPDAGEDPQLPDARPTCTCWAAEPQSRSGDTFVDMVQPVQD
jgi:hypothetical protein